MKNPNRKSSLFGGIIKFTLGIVITAIGIAVMVMRIKDIISYNNSESEAVTQIILSLVFVGFGIFFIVLGSKNFYLRILQSKTFRLGKEVTAKITDYKSMSPREGRNTCIRFAFVLFYNDGISDKTFTTDYMYDVNEYNYLMRFEKVKIKFYNDFATICEPFPKDIYKVDSNYGI